MVHDVYLELAEEEYAPPEKLVRINNNNAARMVGGGEPMEAVIHFAVGDYTEGYNESHFASEEGGRFTIKSVDLVKALIALEILPTGTAFMPQAVDPDWNQE